MSGAIVLENKRICRIYMNEGSTVSMDFNLRVGTMTASSEAPQQASRTRETRHGRAADVVTTVAKPRHVPLDSQRYEEATQGAWHGHGDLGRRGGVDLPVLAEDLIDDDTAPDDSAVLIMKAVGRLRRLVVLFPRSSDFHRARVAICGEHMQDLLCAQIHFGLGPSPPDTPRSDSFGATCPSG